jgi:hypothetical protein
LIPILRMGASRLPVRVHHADRSSNSRLDDLGSLHLPVIEKANSEVYHRACHSATFSYKIMPAKENYKGVSDRVIAMAVEAAIWVV